MESVNKINPVWRNALIYGGIAAGLFIIWFFIMRAFGLHDNFRLRYLNFPILFTCTYVCLNKLHKQRDYTFSYLSGLAQSMLIAGVSVVLFGAFMFLYLTFIDHALMEHIRTNAPFGWLMGPMSMAFWVGHELFGFQVLFSIIVMEYFKLVRHRMGRLKNVNMATFAERPKRKLWGIVFITLGLIAIIAYVASLINPETYPHISGWLRIDSNHLWRVSWAPVFASLFIALGIINLSEFNRRKWIE